MYIIRVTIGGDGWLHETDAGSAEAAIREVCQDLDGRHDPSSGATFAFLDPQQAYEYALGRRRLSLGRSPAGGDPGSRSTYHRARTCRPRRSR